LISLFREYFSDEWPTRRVAYLRIVYTSTEFVGKFFSGEKKIRCRRKYLLHELFHRKKISPNQKFPVEGNEFPVGEIQNGSGHRRVKCWYREAQSCRKVETLN
jgi:hypothetical protein